MSQACWGFPPNRPSNYAAGTGVHLRACGFLHRGYAAIDVVERVGSVIHVLYRVFPRDPPTEICFSAAPPLYATATIGPLPAGQYVISAEGTMGATVIPTRLIGFTVLGGGVASAFSVPAMDAWALLLIAAALLLLGLHGIARNER